MGAHSLAATRAAVRLGRALGKQVPLKVVFEHPTVEALAGWFATALEEGEREEALPELQRAERGREAPLSYAQRRMWFLDQLDPGSVSYTVPNSIQFHGELEPDKLEAALSEIVRRHESLRTTFLGREGEGFQIIHEAQPVRIPLVDFSALPSSERQEAARQRVREQSRQPWDLRNGPLFRVQLIRIAPNEHLFVLTMHHIITDGRSTGVLAQELGVLYRAFVRDRPSPLPAPPVQYADFAIWQRDWLRGNLLEKQLSYWRTRLADLQEIELPTDFPRPKVHRYRGRRESFSISRTTANSLNALARSVGATPFMTLLAGFDVFLATISGQRDICVGTPVANRNRPELENIIGFFVNTLVMRAQIEGDPTFRQLLKHVREKCLEAFDHQDLPFEKLVDELSPARDLSRHPLFQIMFVHQEGALGVELPGISFRQRAAEIETSNFDLLFVTSETADGYDGLLQYNSDLFRQETVARFVEQFAVLFERLAAAPDLPLSQISPFVGNELDSILEWGQGPSVPAGSRLIQDWLARHAQAAPARLVAETEWGSLTYGELDRLSNQLAHSLREDGLGPDRIAGLCVERSPEMLVGLFGILKAGGAFLAIDPEYPDERISLMLEEAAVQIMVAQDTLRDRLEALVPNGALVVHSPARKEASSDRGDKPPPIALHPENLAYVIFTSGSTGRPKGVLVEHRNAVHMIEAQLAAFGIDASSRVLQTLSLSFDAALREIFRAISAGATLFLAPRDQLMPGPGLVALMRERHITAVALPPTVLGALPTEAAQALQELRTLTVGGEACPIYLAKRWGKARHMVNGYGPTETTSATVAVDWDLDTKPPLGRPLANATVYVLDANMRPVQVGVPGELFIGGAGVTRGYLNRPELTAEVFVPDPFSDEPGRRLYRTGDRVRWLADGQLDFLGRKDFQVKIRGFRIEPGEIAAVAQRHDAVDQCVVDVREDRGVRRLIGYATRENEGKTVSSSELRAFVKERLPDYMVPSAFVFIATIPMTVNGKVDYKNLPKPDLNALFSETVYVAPRNDLEERLAKIWQQVIGIEKVGIHANFFELGGDSILSIQMVARATEMGIAFSVRDVFEHQTIAELALVAERSAGSEADQGPVTGEVPLTPIQHWYFEQNSGEPAHFNHSMTLPANPAVFRDGLMETALRALCEHHDALRARFRRDQDGHWKQIFAEPGDVPVIERYDLSASSEQERKTTIEERREAAHQALNLEDGPIFRVLLFNFGSGVSSRMVLIVHHLVTDIVSWQILVQDLMTAIQKIANGGNPQFPPKTTSYRRWAELLVEYAKSPELKSQVDHWLDPMRLDVGRLPVDFPAGKNGRSASTKYTGSLDEDETRRLTESLPRRAGVKVLDILVTALAETLCRWSGHPRIVIDLEGHGREEIGSEKLNLSRTIGWFTSFYPALLELPASDDLRDSLSETARRLDAVPSRGLGYGVIRYLLSDEIVRGRLSSLPRAEVAFNYTGHGGHGHGRGTSESEAPSPGHRSDHPLAERETAPPASIRDSGRRCQGAPGGSVGLQRRYLRSRNGGSRFREILAESSEASRQVGRELGPENGNTNQHAACAMRIDVDCKDPLGSKGGIIAKKRAVAEKSIAGMI